MKQLIVFTDCGDTLVDEASQILAPGSKDLVLCAGLIDGAREELCQLKARGFRVAMVADGLAEAFGNIVRQHGLEEFFEAYAISETVGCYKPDARMFHEAMRQMKLTEEDIPRIVMIGNNIKRDILGANRLGICSILLTWSDRYCMDPETEEETPDYCVKTPGEIVPLLEKLEQKYLQTHTVKNTGR